MLGSSDGAPGTTPARAPSTRTAVRDRSCSGGDPDARVVWPGSEGGGVYYPPRRGPAVAAYETVAAVAMGLAEGRLWVTEGAPCTAAAERFDLGSLIALAA